MTAAAEAKTKTITVIVSEYSSPFPPVCEYPLIYTVEVFDQRDEAEVRTRVAQERYEELSGEQPVNFAVFREIYEGITIHFCFAGDIETLEDWRL